MSLTVSFLEKVQESARYTTDVREISIILLAAINDWPYPILDLEDYEKKIYMLVGRNVDRKKLETFISSIDHSKYAWEAESLSQIVEVYNYYEEKKPLKDILKEFKEKIA